MTVVEIDEMKETGGQENETGKPLYFLLGVCRLLFSNLVAPSSEILFAYYASVDLITLQKLLLNEIVFMMHHGTGIERWTTGMGGQLIDTGKLFFVFMHVFQSI